MTFKLFSARKASGVYATAQALERIPLHSVRYIPINYANFILYVLLFFGLASAMLCGKSAMSILRQTEVKVKEESG